MADQSSNRWTSLDLTIQAIQMIAAHWKQILIVLVPIYAFQWGVLVFFERFAGLFIDGVVTEGVQGLFKFWSLGVGFIVIWIIGAACLAVLWHRLVLRPNAIKPPLSALGRYFWYAFLLWLALAIVAWLLLAVGGMMLRGVSPSQYEQFSYFWPFLVLSLVMSTVFTWLWIRFGLVLPASAVGDKDMTFVFSWFETQRASWSIFVLALIEGVLWLAMDQIGAQSGLGAADFLLTPLPVLLGLAALSVLYRDLETRTEPA